MGWGGMVGRGIGLVVVTIYTQENDGQWRMHIAVGGGERGL